MQPNSFLYVWYCGEDSILDNDCDHVYKNTVFYLILGKFCNLLARLPELTRLCVVGKDQLTQRQMAGDVPQYSLLSELLKGDAAIA